MNLGSFLLPCPTAVTPPNPLDLISFFENTVHFILFSFAIFFAISPNFIGGHSFGGRFATSLVNLTASEIIIEFFHIDDDNQLISGNPSGKYDHLKELKPLQDCGIE